MSFCSFRRVFRPTVGERIHDLKQIIQLHDESIGHCGTCEHYIPSDAPGFVTDFGKCEVRNHWFEEKVSGLKNADCGEYRERPIDKLRKELSELEESLNKGE